jgi:homoserine dehydrogenase
MIKVAVLGFGVVGSGVINVLEKNAGRISQNAGQDIQVKYILDTREFPDSPYKALFAKDFDVIADDPEIAVVVEAIGGKGAALEYTRRSLELGKNVVTSNKELVAEYGSELMKLAMEKGVNYLFEASVGGGIPVIRPIVQCMTANTIGEIYGILNGTTNYILTDMRNNGTGFLDSLHEAQIKGYAESDPTADIDGHDTCRKICILSSLAFGRHVYPKYVQTEGIRGVTTNDISYAAKLGYEIKLLGRSRCTNGKISAYVAPHLISSHNLLAVVGDVMNAVVIRGNAVGNVMFYGAGAGKLPTASAVVADIIDAVKHLHARRWIGWEDGSAGIIEDSATLASAWYIRTAATREKVEREFGTVLFTEETGSETAFITNVISGKMLEELLGRGITALSKFRILGDH